MEPYDSNYKMKPPLRSSCDVGAIVEGIGSGAVEVIATDHAPHAGSDKMQEFERCPFGIIGLETALPLALERLVAPGVIPLTRMIAMFTANPARILGFDRGTLAPEAPADVTIFDPQLSWTYDVNRSYSKSRNSPFDGRTFKGGAVATIANGAFAWRRDGDS
jgi:dihydroorotase